MNLSKLPLLEFNKKIKLLINLNNVKKSSSKKILHPKKSLINYFSINKRIVKNSLGKFSEMIFFGLNYNAKRIKHFCKPWVLDLQKSHKVSVLEKRNAVIKTKVFKRRVLFFSYSRSKLSCMVSKLKKLRSQNSYSGHGLILKEDRFSTKPGKIRQK